MNPKKPTLSASVLFVVVLAISTFAQNAPKSSVIDARQLLGDLRALAADEMQGRETGTAGASKARDFIGERFKASGIKPFGASYEQTFSFTSRGSNSLRRGINMVGQIAGMRQPRRYIVVSAHYDHLGVRNGRVFNGADDNASGTAALFAIGKYFSVHPPSNSLILAAFDAEEVGLQGSRAFVKEPPVSADSLVLNLNADMIGRAPDDKLFVVGTAAQPFLRPHVDAVIRKAPVKLLTGHEGPNPREDWTRDSDHYSFMQAKIPALYIGVEDFSQHHQPTDDYETMGHDFYVRAVETLIQLIERFDANLDVVERAKP